VARRKTFDAPPAPLTQKEKKRGGPSTHRLFPGAWGTIRVKKGKKKRGEGGKKMSGGEELAALRFTLG